MTKRNTFFSKLKTYNWFYLIILFAFILIGLTIYLVINIQYMKAVICLLIAGLIFTITPLLKTFSNRYDSFINYFKTIIATLLGVFIAITITQSESQRVKLNTTLEILQSTKNNIVACKFSTYSLLGGLTEKNGIYNYKNMPIYQKFLPNILFDILKMEIVLENISPPTLVQLSIMTSDMLILYNNLNDRNDNFIDFINKDSLYCENLRICWEILDHELKYQRKEISLDSLNKNLEAEFNDYRIIKHHYHVILH